MDESGGLRRQHCPREDRRRELVCSYRCHRAIPTETAPPNRRSRSTRNPVNKNPREIFHTGERIFFFHTKRFDHFHAPTATKGRVLFAVKLEPTVGLPSTRQLTVSNNLLNFFFCLVHKQRHVE